MSIARIAYRIIDINGPGKHGVTMDRDKAVEYWLDGYEVHTRLRWYYDNGHKQYERRGWKKYSRLTRNITVNHHPKQHKESEK